MSGSCPECNGTERVCLEPECRCAVKDCRAVPQSKHQKYPCPDCFRAREERRK